MEVSKENRRESDGASGSTSMGTPRSTLFSTMSVKSGHMKSSPSPGGRASGSGVGERSKRPPAASSSMSLSTMLAASGEGASTPTSIGGVGDSFCAASPSRPSRGPSRAAMEGSRRVPGESPDVATMGLGDPDEPLSPLIKCSKSLTPQRNPRSSTPGSDAPSAAGPGSARHTLGERGHGPGSLIVASRRDFDGPGGGCWEGSPRLMQRGSGGCMTPWGENATGCESLPMKSLASGRNTVAGGSRSRPESPVWRRNRKTTDFSSAAQAEQAEAAVEHLASALDRMQAPVAPQAIQGTRRAVELTDVAVKACATARDADEEAAPVSPTRTARTPLGHASTDGNLAARNRLGNAMKRTGNLVMADVASDSLKSEVGGSSCSASPRLKRPGTGNGTMGSAIGNAVARSGSDEKSGTGTKSAADAALAIVAGASAPLASDGAPPPPDDGHRAVESAGSSPKMKRRQPPPCPQLPGLLAGLGSGASSACTASNATTNGDGVVAAASGPSLGSGRRAPPSISVIQQGPTPEPCNSPQDATSPSKFGKPSSPRKGDNSRSKKSTRKNVRKGSENGFGFKPSSRSSSEASNADKRGSDNDGDNLKDRRTSSIHSDGRSSTTCYVNFDNFDLEMDGRVPTQLKSWDQLFALHKAASPKSSPRPGYETKSSTSLDQPIDDTDWNIRQAIEWYGWETPTKFQAVAIPCITQACRNWDASRSYTLLQAQPKLGKTSALALGILTAVKRNIMNLQYVIVAVDSCEDLERYLGSLGVLCSVKVAYFRGSDALEDDDVEADVEAAQGAQIIVGHPVRVSKILEAGRGRLELEAIAALLIDDASLVVGNNWVENVCDINKQLSAFARRPIRYVVVSDFAAREAKAALRALKSSLMSKKNMFDLSAQVERIRKFIKHYLVVADPKVWIETLLQLRRMIWIPRAVIFCDVESRFKELQKTFEMMTRQNTLRGASKAAPEEVRPMTVSIMDPSQPMEQRREALTLFINGQRDFLLSRTEPNIFQTSLPRVFWIIHFGIEESNLQRYGCRLLCMDQTLRQKAGRGPHHDGVSICFLPNAQEEPQQRPSLKGAVEGAGAFGNASGADQETAAPQIEKMFQLKFENLPVGVVDWAS